MSKFHYYINASWVIIAILFLFGGLGSVTVSLTFIGVLVSYSLVYSLYLSKGKITLPKGILAYALFLLLFLISLFWSKVSSTTLIYFFMFLAGGLFWIFFYNFKFQRFLKMEYFESMVIFLGLGFGAITIYNFLTHSTVVNASGLINYTVTPLNHHHIGDLWGAILGPLVYILTKKTKHPYVLYILTAFSIYFLAVSFSRSAYVALFSGLFYFLFDLKTEKDKKKLVYIFLFITAVLCIWSSVGKGLITHRLFYISGLIGSLKHPFGIGVGGFGVLLQENLLLLPTFGYSSVADNIVLDMVVGLGVLSVPFLFWLFEILKKLLTNKDMNTMQYKIFFVILTVNFMFNHIYVIPVIVWLWFASLALWQE